MSESPTSSSRIPSLDGIRALAITLVCVGHFAYNAGFRWWTDLYAHYGVRIFLVLSGFLITTLLKREQEDTGTINLKRFFIRRAYRILPAAYAYMILVSIVFGDSFTSRDLVVTFTYLSSYFHLPWLLSHLWSLSVEEQFYLLWPAAMALGIMLARRFAFGAIVFAPVFQFAMAKIGLALVAFYCFPSVADSLAAGCLLAIYQTKLEKYRSFFAWRGFPLIWALTLSFPFLLHYRYLLRFWPLPQLLQVSAQTLFSVGVVLCIQNAIVARHRILNMPFVVWLGTISYSLYLWQMPFANPEAQSWFTAFPQNLVLALLAAIVSFYAIEQPALKLRGRRAAPIPIKRPQVSVPFANAWAARAKDVV